MCPTAGAGHLHPFHAMTAIGVRFDRGRIHRDKEARPAAAGFELRIALEQLSVACNTAIDAVRVVAIERSGEGGLCPFLPRDVVLLGRQLRAPLCICLLYLCCFCLRHSILTSRSLDGSRPVTGARSPRFRPTHPSAVWP